jgi:hypothetical protein
LFTRCYQGEKPAGLPKAPRSSYLCFCIVEIPRLRAEHPEWAFGEYAREAGTRWRAMSEAEKRPYEEQALEDQGRFARERDAYLLAQGMR